MATIKAKLRTAILTGAVGFLPSVALADVGANDGTSANLSEGVPDHAEAEAQGARVDTTSSSSRTTPDIPDHARAEAHPFGDPARAADGTPLSVPDHAAAERRGGGGGE